MQLLVSSNGTGDDCLEIYGEAGKLVVDRPGDGAEHPCGGRGEAVPIFIDDDCPLRKIS